MRILPCCISLTSRLMAFASYVVQALRNYARNMLRSSLFLSFYCACVGSRNANFLQIADLGAARIAWLMLCFTASGVKMRSIPMGRYTVRPKFSGLSIS